MKTSSALQPTLTVAHDRRHKIPFHCAREDSKNWSFQKFGNGLHINISLFLKPNNVKWFYKYKKTNKSKILSVLCKGVLFQFKLVEIFSIFRHFMLAKMTERERSTERKNRIYYFFCPTYYCNIPRKQQIKTPRKKWTFLNSLYLSCCKKPCHILFMNLKRSIFGYFQCFASISLFNS